MKAHREQFRQSRSVDALSRLASWSDEAGGTKTVCFKKGGQCPGEAVAALFLKMAQSFEPQTKDLADALVVLQKHGVLRSSKYWQRCAVAGKSCSSDYVSEVIRNFVAVAKH